MLRLLILLMLLTVASCSSIRSRYHLVRAGESLASIADRYEVPVGELKDRNLASLKSGIKPGIKLYVPFEESPSWDEAELVEEVSKASSSSVTAPVASLDAEKVRFGWPVSGRISSYFGMKRYLGGSRTRKHGGLDIAAPRGTPVKAARSGHVIYATNRISGYGNMVIVRHADSFSTIYAHLSRFHAHKGQFVARGQLIGRVGRTGRSTNNHLHFEIRNGVKPVNPLLYLQKYYAKNP